MGWRRESGGGKREGGESIRAEQFPALESSKNSFLCNFINYSIA